MQPDPNVYLTIEVEEDIEIEVEAGVEKDTQQIDQKEVSILKKMMKFWMEIIYLFYPMNGI